jgi:3-oxoacyl-[acyl-carrier protein] reductase
MDLGFEGRRIVVIGGTYGIGRAAAELMAGEGAHLLIVSRSANNLG